MKEEKAPTRRTKLKQTEAIPQAILVPKIHAQTFSRRQSP
jgi:hypothetical protein